MISNDKLRQRILEMAFCGKLVNNNKELEKFDLKEIEKNKHQKVLDGLLREEKKLSEISDKDIPYTIPDNWQWVRLGNYVEKITDQVASGSFASLRENVKSLKEPDYAIMVKVADFANNFSSNLTYTDEHGYNFLSNSNLFGGELILSNVGSIGKIFIVPKLDSKMTLAPNSVMIRFVNDEHRDYIYYFLLSTQGYREILDITTGTAVRKFNKTDLKKILIPIPPLEEQKAIVTRIKELFDLIDVKEKNDKEIEKYKEKLKGKIINKFCPTNENCVSLEEISYIVSKGTTPRGGNVCYKDDGVLFLRAENLGYGYNNLLNKKYVDFETHNGFLKRSILEENDILVSIAGALGRTSFVEKDLLPCNCNQAVAFVRIKKGIDFIPKYICYCIMSKNVQDSLLSQVKKTAQPNLTLEHIKKIRIPLPSLEEQKKIVDKIENSFELIEQL